MLPLHQPSHYRRVSNCASQAMGAFLPEFYDVRGAWGECGCQEESGALPRPTNGCMFLSLISSSLRSPSGSKRLTPSSLYFFVLCTQLATCSCVDYCFVNVLRHMCPCFARAHLLDISEGFDHGGKGLIHLISSQHMFEWKKHPILPLKLTEGNLRVVCSPVQSSAPTYPSNLGPSEMPGYMGGKGRSGKVWPCGSTCPKSWILVVSWGQLAHLVP